MLPCHRRHGQHLDGGSRRGDVHPASADHQGLRRQHPDPAHRAGGRAGGGPGPAPARSHGPGGGADVPPHRGLLQSQQLKQHACGKPLAAEKAPSQASVPDAGQGPFPAPKQKFCRSPPQRPALIVCDLRQSVKGNFLEEQGCGLFSRRGSVGVPHRAAEREALDPVDQERGQGDSDEREGDPPEGDIAEGQHQYHHVGEKVAPGQPPAGDLGDGQGQGVVAAAGAALPYDDAHAHAHEHGAQQGGRQRVGRKVGQHGREQLPHLVEQRDAEGGHRRDLDEPAAQVLEGQQVTGDVQHRGDEGGGHAKPVLHQQHQTHDAPLGDAGLLVDVVDAEGADHGAQHDQPHPPQGQPVQQAADQAGGGVAIAKHKNLLLHFGMVSVH